MGVLKMAGRIFTNSGSRPCFPCFPVSVLRIFSRLIRQRVHTSPVLASPDSRSQHRRQPPSNRYFISIAQKSVVFTVLVDYHAAADFEHPNASGDYRQPEAGIFPLLIINRKHRLRPLKAACLLSCSGSRGSWP